MMLHYGIRHSSAPSGHTNKHYLNFFACATKLSITCSNASLSPSALSMRFCQYSNTSFALTSRPFSRSTCSSSSFCVRFCNAASVVEHSIVVLLMSNSGGGGGPFLFLSGFEADESTDVDDAFSPSRFTRPSAPLRPSDDGRGDLSPGIWIEGKISFFCLDAGRISSRSTGTPRETRKRRRMRERTQSGGCNGGGATSCVQSDLLRSVRNIDRASSVDADMLGISWNEG
jgi:hypothetical protein